MRWQDAIFALIPALDALTWRAPARTRVLALAAAAGAWLIVFSPQMAVWNALYGQPLAMPQGPSFMQWGTPYLLSVLFSGRYDHLGEYLPMAALLIIGLPIEAQLVWTLLSDGLGRIAVAALTTRLLLVLAGATIFVLSAPDASFLLLILAPVAATGVSLVMQGGALAMFEMAEQRAARRLAASGAK